MKQIKRYNISIKQNVANYFADCGNIIQSEQEDENGDWCRYEDVQSLEKENEELRKYKKALEEIRDKIIETSEPWFRNAARKAGIGIYTGPYEKIIMKYLDIMHNISKKDAMSILQSLPRKL